MGRQVGRPPTPNEVKRRRGTDRPDRGVRPAGNVVVLPTDTTPPDPHRPLGRAGRHLWDAVWMHAWAWTARSDTELLQMVCEMADERVGLRARVLRAEQQRSEGVEERALVASWRDRLALRQLDAQLTDGLSLLGLTPVDRSRIGAAEVRPTGSKLDALRRPG
jgi:hypothetical protein